MDKKHDIKKAAYIYAVLIRLRENKSFDIKDALNLILDKAGI